MAPRKSAPANIETRIIRVFEEQSMEFDKGGGSELRVIAWIVNGSEKAPQLERREWWRGEDGSKRSGKAKGLSASDFTFILENRKEIGQHLGIPARIVDTAVQQSEQEPESVAAGAEGTDGGEGW